jgi:hypothetical protein
MPTRPRFRFALPVALAVAACLACSAPAAAQDVLAVMRTDSMDWSAIDRAHPRPTAAALRAMGICPSEVEQGAPYFHLVDVDADGRLDLVYSGPNTFCKGAAEGENTTVYANRGARLQRIFQAYGGLVGMWRVAPWQPFTLVVRQDGCCADWARHLVAFHPRAGRDGWRYDEVTSVETTYETRLPKSALPAPRAFTVGQDAYNLRIAPVVDDTAEGQFMVDDRHGNVHARYARGSRGLALSEETDATGRVWWFVVMQSPAVGDAPVTGNVPTWKAGWMSSRFVVPDAEAPTGRADPESLSGFAP